MEEAVTRRGSDLFKVISQYSLGGAEVNYDKFRTGYAIAITRIITAPLLYYYEVLLLIPLRKHRFSNTEKPYHASAVEETVRNSR
jgi:hypothetical protein